MIRFQKFIWVVPFVLEDDESIFLKTAYPSRKMNARFGGSNERKTNLDSYERQIESGIQSYVPIAGAKRRKIQTILDTTRKTKNINIRISQQDLASLRRSAEQEGIPYQTLISSVLHKYLAGRLVDEVSIRKSVEILSRKPGPRRASQFHPV